MPGTMQGGKKAAITNKDRHGADYYARIGKLGGASRGTPNQPKKLIEKEQ